jgi:ATP-dependent Clp endopeptidase proteolytic subunit ClpP
LTTPHRQFPKAKAAFYEVKAAVAPAEGPSYTDLYIYDIIGDDWWDPSLTAKELVQRINAIETDEIRLHLSSPGGSVSDGMAIYNALLTHPASVLATIEGWTGSVATVIAMAAERVEMFENTMFIIHNPWGVAIGDAAALRDYAEMLDRVAGQMRAIYMARITKTEDELQQALDAETFLDAEQAVEWGFVDEVLSAKFAAAACDVTLLQSLGYHIPEPMLAAQADDSSPSSEDAADAGGSPEVAETPGGSPERVFLAGGTLITFPDTPKGE